MMLFCHSSDGSIYNTLVKRLEWFMGCLARTPHLVRIHGRAKDGVIHFDNFTKSCKKPQQNLYTHLEACLPRLWCHPRLGHDLLLVADLLLDRLAHRLEHELAVGPLLLLADGLHHRLALPDVSVPVVVAVAELALLLARHSALVSEDRNIYAYRSNLTCESLKNMFSI